MKTNFWDVAKMAMWVPIVYFGTKVCFDSVCAQEVTYETETEQYETLDDIFDYQPEILYERGLE